MSVQIDVSQGKHGDYLLIRATKDTVNQYYSEQTRGYIAELHAFDIAEVKSKVDADPRLGDRRPV